MPKLTKRIIDAVEPHATEFFLWDEGIPGFGLRAMPSGRKSIVVQFRAGRHARRMSLGPSTVLTCDQSRTRAITIIMAVKNGDDPVAEHDAKRNAATVSDLAERFDKEHISVGLKSGTAKVYRSNLMRFILPALGRLPLPEITRVDVAKFHHDLRHIPYQALRNCLGSRVLVSGSDAWDQSFSFQPDLPEAFKNWSFLSCSAFRNATISAIVRIGRLCACANTSSSGLRAIWPSSPITSQMTPASNKPAISIRSTAPSV